MQVSRPQYGCNTFQFTTQDGTVVVGRGMDYPQGPNVNMNTQILAVNRQEECNTTAPDEQPGLSWVSKYGFVGTNAFGLDCFDDGMNQAGLSLALLSLPETIYRSVKPCDEKIA